MVSQQFQQTANTRPMPKQARRGGNARPTLTVHIRSRSHIVCPPLITQLSFRANFTVIVLSLLKERGPRRIPFPVQLESYL